PYLSRTACCRSTPATLAIVASHARTSANSRASSSGLPSRSAAASSPTSSISHMNVPSIPRASSFDEYIVRISDCKSARENERVSEALESDATGGFFTEQSSEMSLQFVEQGFRRSKLGLALQERFEPTAGRL